MTMTSDALLALFKAGKPHFTPAFDLRLYRAISWLKKAESTEDLDIRFISLWIAFNAAYAKELEAGSLSDRSAFRQFLHTLCHLDKSQQIYQLVWETFPGSIRMLLDNRFVFQAFAADHAGKSRAPGLGQAVLSCHQGGIMPVVSLYPRHWQCTQCSWKDPLLQHGDAFFAPSSRRCPRCGGEITLKKAGLVDRMVFEWKSRKHRKSA